MYYYDIVRQAHPCRDWLSSDRKFSYKLKLFEIATVESVPRLFGRKSVRMAFSRAVEMRSIIISSVSCTVVIFAYNLLSFFRSIVVYYLDRTHVFVSLNSFFPLMRVDNADPFSNESGLQIIDTYAISTHNVCTMFDTLCI